MVGDKVVMRQRHQQALNCWTHKEKQVWLYRLPLYIC